MKSSILVFFAFSLLGIFATSAEKSKPTLIKTPLSAEEVEVYGTFLDSFVGKGKDPVNLSDKTFPLTLSDSDNRGPCLGGIKLENSEDASRSIHAFQVSISSGRAIKLVDERTHKVKDPGKAIKHGESVDTAVRTGFQIGILSVSEIVFDESHRFAVFKFRFYCGLTCGRGATMVFERVDSKWKESSRPCPLWVA